MASFGDHGLYLPFLHQIEQGADPTGALGSRLAELLAQVRAMIGDEAGAFRTMAGLTHPPPPLPEQILKGLQALDARDAIVRAAKDRQIVILNEAHHISRCRAFALDIALMLRDIGFDTFTAEGLNEGADVDLNSGRPITMSAGLYLRDPVYAELLRGVRRAGYRFAVYEQRSDQIAARGANSDDAIGAREEAQAENVVAILAARPKARIFIYCGFGHVAKAPGNEGVMFAARLKAKSGIDPLCITQSDGAPAPDPMLDPTCLTNILDRFRPRQPIALDVDLVHPDGKVRSVDLSVFHPRLPYVEGRPGWLARAVGRRPAQFRFSNSASGAGLVQAVAISEAQTANVVPGDQLPILPGMRTATFFLTAGTYEIRLEADVGRRVLGIIDVV